MSNEAQGLLEQALRLPVEERAELFLRIGESMDPPGDDLSPEEWKASWAAELDAREAAMDSGEMKVHTWEEVRAEMELRRKKQ